MRLALATLIALVLLPGAASADVNFSSPFPSALPDNTQDWTVGDVNADGIPDAVSASSFYDSETDTSYEAVSVQLNNGGGSFGAPTTYPLLYEPGEGVENVAIRDFTGDGNADILLARTYHLLVFPGNGHGAFGGAIETRIFSDASFIEVGDWDEDGDVDVATVSICCAEMTVVQNNGDGSFDGDDQIFSDLPTNEIEDVQKADLNGDGHLDLVIGSHSPFDPDSDENGVFVALGDGDGNLGPAERFEAFREPEFVEVADFDGNGDPDVAVTDSESGAVGIMLGDGEGNLGTATPYPSAADPDTFESPYDLDAADLDGDGDQDLVVIQFFSDDLTVLLNDGSGGFAQARDFPTGTSAWKADTADVDTDGDPDIVAFDYESLVVLYNIPPVEGPPGDPTCADGTDNDRDGSTDQADSDCQSPEGPLGDPSCSDSIDNDGDGQTDTADTDCQPVYTPEGPPGDATCSDGIDNDGDGQTDQGDADCQSAEGPPGDGSCSDGIDNDGDGDADLADPDCQIQYTPEGPPGDGSCFDGVDNDGDGFADSADSDCQYPPEGPPGDATCSDNVDNDGDGATDLADSDCQLPPVPGARCDGQDATIGGTTGTPGDDVIVGTDGPDTIDGGGGNDVICGRGGADDITGGEGNDRLFGQVSADVIRGGAGDDRLVGGMGGDELRGEAGDDRVEGVAGNDQLFGGDDADVLLGGAGDDTGAGGDGQDRFTGGIGDDVAEGNAGDDDLRGGDGDDSLDGGADTDACYGQKGTDTSPGGCEKKTSIP